MKVYIIFVIAIQAIFNCRLSDFPNEISPLQIYFSVPFEVIGDRKIFLLDKEIEKEMKGKISIMLFIDKNGKLINFAIMKINITDNLNENVIKYDDNRFYTHVADPYKFNLEFYPEYVKPIYGKIEETIKKWKFKKIDKIHLDKYCALVINIAVNPD